MPNILSAVPLAFLLAGGHGRVPPPKPSENPPSRGGWLGDEVPLALPVRTPEDLSFKGTVERQYLIFNLLAAGKLAWDAGDYAAAADRWEALLRTPDLPEMTEQTVRPFAEEARRRAGNHESVPKPLALGAESAPRAPHLRNVAPAERSAPAPFRLTVRGKVSGGGPMGPGGAVVWLKRVDGETPKPLPAHLKTVLQRNKQFVPRVIAVPVGTTVRFRNEDDIFHNVFSLSTGNDFDLGLYKGGVSRDKTFATPGPVELLCNIHSSMGGYIYVVDSAYFAQAGKTGSFAIPNVLPGEYVLAAWHETASHPSSQHISVRADMDPVTIAVHSDRLGPRFPPDKSGKPRQPQLGY